MNIIDILFIGLGLSMDAFAVSVCKGLAMKKMNIKKALVCSLYFGVFQALMPLIGYFLGSGFKNVVSSVDHWIAFVLLGIIGINMIKEAKSCEVVNDAMDVKTMLTLAVATNRCTCNRSYIRIFKSKYCPGYFHNWCNNLCLLLYRG